MIAPLTDYINNPVFKEVPDKEGYYGDGSDKRIYVDLRNSMGYTNEIEKPLRNDSKITLNIELKNALAKKMRLRPWGYSNGEYLHMLIDGNLTLKYKTCTIKSQDDKLKE